MEDNKHLLLNILQRRYASDPDKLGGIYNIIKTYSEKERTKIDYEKVLNTLHGIMSNDIPKSILLYFLTTVPLPDENVESNSSDLYLYNLMRKSRIALPENIKSTLQEYLKELSDAQDMDENKRVLEDNQRGTTTNGEVTKAELNEEGVFLKPKKKAKASKKVNQNNSEYKLDYCQSLLDISAQYVVTNYNYLNHFYKKKNEMVWNMLHKNPCHEDKQSCFTVLKDLNKKRKWLRMIDSDNILPGTLKDDFKDGYSMLKKRKESQEESKTSSFQVSEELRNAIIKYINSTL